MKPLERIFFQACIMRILLDDKCFVTFRDIVNVFSALGFSYKKLWYYISKWERLGFYGCGVAEDMGWFYPDKFTGEYKVMYDAIVNKGGGKGGRN